MSHIVVGERILGQAPELIGHILVGGGHFIEQGSGLIQQFSQSGNIVPILASNRINDLSGSYAIERWQWDNIQNRYGSGVIMAASNNESEAAERALRESIDKSFENQASATKDALLAIGSAMAGDPASAVEHGTAAIEKYTTGMLKDLGFLGGWGTGPTPGQGTCPPFPDNGR